MDHLTQTSSLSWNGIPFTITYTPEWSLMHDDQVVSHIEILSDQPLAITMTGYKSLFFFQEQGKQLSCVNQFVLEELSEQSQSKKWMAYLIEQKQPSLF